MTAASTKMIRTFPAAFASAHSASSASGSSTSCTQRGTTVRGAGLGDVDGSGASGASSCSAGLGGAATGELSRTLGMFSSFPPAWTQYG